MSSEMRSKSSTTLTEIQKLVKEAGFWQDQSVRERENLIKAVNEIKELQHQNSQLVGEVERLTNRVNLLSVSANTIRDAYDKGLNAELQAENSRLRELIEFIEAEYGDAMSPADRDKAKEALKEKP